MPGGRKSLRVLWKQVTRLEVSSLPLITEWHKISSEKEGVLGTWGGAVRLLCFSTVSKSR